MSEFKASAEGVKMNDEQKALDREIERKRKSTICFFLFAIVVWSFFAIMLSKGTPEGPLVLANIQREVDSVGYVIFSVLGLIASGLFMSSLLTYIELLIKGNSTSKE